MILRNKKTDERIWVYYIDGSNYYFTDSQRRLRTLKFEKISKQYIFIEK